MNISINPINQQVKHLNITSYKNRNSEMTFGHIEANKQLKRVGFALFAVSMLSLGSCINKQNDTIDNEIATQTMNVNSTAQNNNYKINIKDYKADIDSFMNADNSIVNVKITEGIDASYANAYKEIIARGYDVDCNLKRIMDIHPIVPTQSCSIDEVYCPEPEIAKTIFYDDKKITESIDNGHLLYRETEYSNTVALDGKDGYKFKEVEYEDGSMKIYTLGEAEGNYAKTKDYHKRIYVYDINGKTTDVFDFVPNETNEIILKD